MKERIFGVVFVIFIMVILLSFEARAYTIDGDISDWGVVLSVGGDGKFNCDWTPNAGFYAEANDWGPDNGMPSGGEAFDVEALYFDNDDLYAYFALVTSVDPNGRQLNYPYNWPFMFGPGDLAIKFDADKDTFWNTSDADYGIGTRPVVLSGGTSGGKRLPASWGEVNKNVGGNLKWYHENGYSWSEFDQAYFDANSGTEVGVLGASDIVWSQWHSSNDIGVGYLDSPKSITGTWVLEAGVPVSYFGSDWVIDRDISIRWASDCVNDYIELNGKVTPEPATLILLGSLATGLFGMAAVRRKK